MCAVMLNSDSDLVLANRDLYQKLVSIHRKVTEMLLLFGSVDSLVAPRPYYDENIRMTDMPGLENCMTMRYKLRFIGVRERKN